MPIVLLQADAHIGLVEGFGDGIMAPSCDSSSRAIEKSSLVNCRRPLDLSPNLRGATRCEVLHYFPLGCGIAP